MVQNSFAENRFVGCVNAKRNIQLTVYNHKKEHAKSFMLKHLGKRALHVMSQLFTL